MREQPDITLAEPQGRLAAEKAVAISLQAINETLRALGYSFKKTSREGEQDRPDIAVKRWHWRRWQHWLRPEPRPTWPGCAGAVPAANA